MVTRMDREKASGSKVDYDELDQLYNRVTYANDEGDPGYHLCLLSLPFLNVLISSQLDVVIIGMGLHVGLHLFCLSLHQRRDVTSFIILSSRVLSEHSPCFVK
jgi:hypothetical protein